MAFQLSPGVLVTEEDRSTIVPSVATTAGAFAGTFQWGPVDAVTSVDSEINLVERFGRPNDDTAAYFFTAANFLSYGNNLQIVRVVDKVNAKNAVSTPSGKVTNVTIISSPTDLLNTTGWVVEFSAPTQNGGITAQGNVFLSSNGSVQQINITNEGFGYTLPPLIGISGGNGQGAQGTATLVNGKLIEILVADRGNNYSTLSTVSISAPLGVATQGAANTANAVLDITYSLPFPNVVVGGTNYNSDANIVISAPDDPAGTIATAQAIIGYGVDTNFTIVEAGNNYIDGLVTVTFTGGGGTGANANVTLGVDGEITAVNLISAGNGYITAPTVVISRNDSNTGIEANVTATLDSNGSITAIVMTSVGSGYNTAPTVTVNRNNANTGTNAEVNVGLGYGKVRSVILTNTGLGYDRTPNVTINKNSALGGTNVIVIPRFGAGVGGINITNEGFGYNANPTISIVPDINDIISNTAVASAIVKYPLGGVNITNPGSGYTLAPGVTISIPNSVAATATSTITTEGVLITNQDNYDDVYTFGGLLFGQFAAKYPGKLGNSIRISMADAATFNGWQYANQFDFPPGTSSYVSQRGGSSDEMHILILDAKGEWTGVVGAILEKYSFVSKAIDAKRTDGTSNYYKDVLNTQSKYVWWLNHPVGTSNWGSVSADTAFNSLTSNVTTTLGGGVSADVANASVISSGYINFENDELYDVSLIPMGPTNDFGAVNSVISIAEKRRDCLVFVSPPVQDVVNTLDQATKIVNYRNLITGSSFAVMDSGWKYQYDRYNDTYRYVPLNGDIAGLVARTDYIADPWFSPAGYNRGGVKNVVKLPYSPSKADRDELYKKGVNPVVTFPGQGTILFGDKTLQSRPSAFDRINVRRLFIVLEKAIATASKFQLFEFNDAFTRAQFRNLVEPFLRDVQGRRGITDFRVICDETNNTAEIIDRNEFVADIFVKPARSINFIRLNFVATRSGVSFEELGA